MLTCLPQLWHCSICGWVGDIATRYVRQHFHKPEQQEAEVKHVDEHPTCPACSGHRFKVYDASASDEDRKLIL